MQLTKRQFCDYVETFQKMLQQESELVDALNITPEWVPGEWVNHYYDMLEELCELDDDPIYGNDLSWFCFDTEFGQNKDMNKIFDAETGRTWRIEGPDILYDWITREQIYGTAALNVKWVRSFKFENFRKF